MGAAGIEPPTFCSVHGWSYCYSTAVLCTVKLLVSWTSVDELHYTIRQTAKFKCLTQQKVKGLPMEVDH